MGIPLRFNRVGFCSSVMIEKFAIIGDAVSSEFLDLNHTSNSLSLVSL
jgi:hypothetical protein